MFCAWPNAQRSLQGVTLGRLFPFEVARRSEKFGWYIRECTPVRTEQAAQAWHWALLEVCFSIPELLGRLGGKSDPKVDALRISPTSRSFQTPLLRLPINKSTTFSFLLWPNIPSGRKFFAQPPFGNVAEESVTKTAQDSFRR